MQTHVWKTELFDVLGLVDTFYDTNVSMVIKRIDAWQDDDMSHKHSLVAIDDIVECTDRDTKFKTLVTRISTYRAIRHHYYETNGMET